jgi:hypothetical protein
MNEMRPLEVMLTEEELEAVGKLLSSSQIRLRELEAEKKRVMATWKSDIDKIRGQVDELSVKHHSGRMTRMVECEIQRDERQLAIRVVRLDTGEVIEERAMTPDERQVGLPGVG